MDLKHLCFLNWSSMHCKHRINGIMKPPAFEGHGLMIGLIIWQEQTIGLVVAEDRQCLETVWHWNFYLQRLIQEFLNDGYHKLKACYVDIRKGNLSSCIVFNIQQSNGLLGLAVEFKTFRWLFTDKVRSQLLITTKEASSLLISLLPSKDPLPISNSSLHFQTTPISRFYV